MAQQKEYTYDSRFDALQKEVAITRWKSPVNCKCYFVNPEVVCVGIQEDRHKNIEPLYVTVQTCKYCGAKEIT